MFPDEIEELKQNLSKSLRWYSRIGDSQKEVLLLEMLRFHKWRRCSEVGECLRLLEDELSAAAATGQVVLEKSTDNSWLFKAGILCQIQIEHEYSTWRNK